MQQHIGQSTFFNRSWEEFKVGFGSNASDHNYWIGNERLHQLTKSGQYKLRVDVKAKFGGRWYWAEYNKFSVESEANGYLLIIGEYTGNAGDSMTVDGHVSYSISGATFKTYDRSGNAVSCVDSSQQHGGFWYITSSCTYAMVNQHMYFSWKSLPLGTRSGEYVALLRSRMTLVQK